MTDDAALRRRLEVLRLPVVPLRRHGLLSPPDRAAWHRDPAAMGVGPDGTAFAVWHRRHYPARHLITSHRAGRHRTQCLSAVEVETDLSVSFVQPLPDGHVLLVASRCGPEALNAQVWDPDGNLVTTGNLGDAIEELLTTPSGAVWCSHFDESARSVHRYTAELKPDWAYPIDRGLPAIRDCYALNVDGEDAFCCPYPGFPLISIVGDVARDLGPAPHEFVDAVLVRGAEGVLIGGPNGEYDLVVPFRLTSGGVEQAGQPRRLVLPDGIETLGVQYACRGAELHAFRGPLWLRTTLDDLT